MSLISVKEEKCTGCGACVDECPMKILVMKTDPSIPAPVKGAWALCIDCGHCVAVCPHGALSHRLMAAEDCPPVAKDIPLGPESAEQFLRSRRSIRCYREKPVEKDKIEKLIDIARYAPSGHNSQPLGWTVVYETGRLREYASHVIDWMKYLIREMPEMAKSMHMDMVVAGWEFGMDPICRGAPHLVICHADAANSMAPTAAIIALSYLDLAAPSLGVGACWAGFFDAAMKFWPPLQTAMGLPSGHAGLGSLMLGTPRYRFHRLPLRKEPVVSWQ